MEPIELGIWVSAGMLAMVVLGMRVAFAAGLAGLLGLAWIFWSKKGYDPDKLWNIWCSAADGPKFAKAMHDMVAELGRRGRSIARDLEGTNVIDAWVNANNPRLSVEGFGAGGARPERYFTLVGQASHQNGDVRLVFSHGTAPEAAMRP